MRWSRVLSSCAASAAVVGCVALALGMARAGGTPTAAPSPTPAPTNTVRPAYLATASATATAQTSSAALTSPTRASRPAAITSARPTASGSTSTSATASSTASATAPAVPARPAPRVSAHAVHRPAAPTTHAAPRRTTAAPALPRGSSLPLRYTTSDATRVITVVAHSYGSSYATLQAWNRAPGGGWYRYGAAITAHVGSQGLTTAPSEDRSATPMGSFTLTQAFGAWSDPGTALPYTHVNLNYWWISNRYSSLYNTMQYCHPGCSFAASPNEHLATELPYYRYAVVIDANTRNAPGGVVGGRYAHGSAFFLHVTDGRATAGCVAIPQANLTTLMRWLTPTAHPRILIGVA